MMNCEVRLKNCPENEKEKEIVSSCYLYTDTKTLKEGAI
jgi:hypothetical protein